MPITPLARRLSSDDSHHEAATVTDTRTPIANIPNSSGWALDEPRAATRTRPAARGPRPILSRVEAPSPALYVEPDGSFSVPALVWRLGQITGIHPVRRHPRVHNTSGTTTISIETYGVGITRIGSRPAAAAAATTDLSVRITRRNQPR